MFPKDPESQLKNVHAYAVTPFKKDDLSQIDLEGVSRNLTFMIENRVQVINVGGGTGEVDALTDAELETLAQTTLDVARDRALILPTLPGNLKSPLELAPQYEKMGARVVLAMGPFIRSRVRQNLDGVFNYYCTLAGASCGPERAGAARDPTAFFIGLLLDQHMPDDDQQFTSQSYVGCGAALSWATRL